MKVRTTLFILVLAALILSACQPAKPTQPSGGYPAPAQGGAQGGGQGAYPAPMQVAPTPTHGSVLYPDPQSGDQVSWEQTVAMLNNGEVKEVLAGQNLQLTVSLKDGRSLKSSIPPEEDLQKTIEKCGDACKDVVVK